MNMRLAIMFLLIGTLFFSNAGKAQKLVFVYANAMYNTPTGGFKSNGYNYGLGGEAGAGVGFFKKTFATGSIGYNWFHNRFAGVSNLKATPIRFGIRQYLVAKILYVKADAGVAAISADGNSKSKFAAGAGAGVKLAGLNLGIDYNTINLDVPGSKWAGWLAFKAGYSFSL